MITASVYVASIEGRISNEHELLMTMLTMRLNKFYANGIIMLSLP
jgi:hypothetical protein